MKSFRAAVAQFRVVPLQVEQNAASAVDAVADAADQGAALVVLPEMGNTGYVTERDRAFMLSLHEAAEPIPGLYVDALTEAAARSGVHVVAGVCEARREIPGVMSNAAVLISPDRQTWIYRKAHVPSEEKHYFLAGDEFAPFDTDLGKIGLLVCADNSFPEAARILTLAGAEILAVPYAARAPHNPDLYASLAATRAYENQIYVLAANCVGTQHGLSFEGGSAIASPDGQVMARMGTEEGVVTAQLDEKLLLSERLWQSRFRDRRPDLYGPLEERL